MLPEFQSFKSKNNQWLDADRLAVEQILLESPKPSPVVQILKAAFDGHSTRTYFAGDFAKICAGQEKPGFDEDLADRADVRPLLLALRPAELRLSRIEPSTCRVFPMTGKIDNVSCTIVCSDNSPGHHVFYSLDPARDYIVLREYHTANGQDGSRIDISYRSDPTYGPIPDGWHRHNVGDGGGFRDLTTSKVIGYKINMPLPASPFKLEFPKGTETADLTDSPREIPRPQPRRPAASKLP